MKRGTAVNFTCAVSHCNAIEWRIGAFHKNGVAYFAAKDLLKGGIIQESFTEPRDCRRKKTEIIQIIADWNVTAVQCKEVHKRVIHYSRFALLQLEPESDTFPEPG